MMTSISAPRRQMRLTSGKRRGGRSARVVAAVLEATLEELGTTGYSNLRVDDVARRAAVNKTTIYRRWPTRATLVEAALRSIQSTREPPRMVSVREDLLADLRFEVEWFMSPVGPGIARMITIERAHNGSDIDGVVRQLRVEQIARREAIIRGGIARGELPATTDAHLLSVILQSTIFSRFIHLGEPPEDREVVATVDLLLRGACASNVN